MIASAIQIVERAPISDGIAKAGIRYLVGRTRKRLAAAADSEGEFALSMATRPVAIHVEEANEQHYELPPEFFELVLGPQRKYSCCLFPHGDETLSEAEDLALAQTVRNAEIADGQRVLELGCGWGSLTLHIARRFPRCRITAVSNSHAQRQFIESRVSALGLMNVAVVTADMNTFEAAETYDRIISVEMFEHLSNWTEALRKARRWIDPDGRLFLHVFSHENRPYRFDHTDKADWIARHFFTGGVMPSHGLVSRATDCFAIEADWRWSGQHYERTAEAWLANFDANSQEVDHILRRVYGSRAKVWRRRWRLFFLATAGLFGHVGGNVWGVSHYLMKPTGSGTVTLTRPDGRTAR